MAIEFTTSFKSYYNSILICINISWSYLHYSPTSHPIYLLLSIGKCSIFLFMNSFVVCQRHTRSPHYPSKSKAVRTHPSPQKVSPRVFLTLIWHWAWGHKPGTWTSLLNVFIVVPKGKLPHWFCFFLSTNTGKRYVITC